MTLTKTCPKCQKNLPLSAFYNNRTKPDQRSGICMQCQADVNQGKAVGEAKPKRGLFAKLFGS